MGVNPFNLLTLFILFWTSSICPTIQTKPLSLQNFSELEQKQIITILKHLDVHQRKMLTIRKEELPQYILGMAYNLQFECYIELSPLLFYGPTKQYFKASIYHEIGHCFGLEHVEKETDIMYYQAKPDTTYKYIDWARFLNQLNACF